VLNDLQPYVCTFPDCNLSDHLFESRDAWYNHELQNHRVEFFCNSVDHDVYMELSSFEAHMEEHHGISLQTSPTLLGMFQRPSQTYSGICNLCFQHSKNLKYHVSCHLQQLALFAIPLTAYLRDDEILHSYTDTSRNSHRGSFSKHGRAVTARTVASSVPSGLALENLNLVENEVGEPSETLEEEVEVPDVEEGTWDTVTNKFFQAREGNSDLPPILGVKAPTNIPENTGDDYGIFEPEDSRPKTEYKIRRGLKEITTVEETRLVIGVDYGTTYTGNANDLLPSLKSNNVNRYCICSYQRWSRYTLRDPIR
jgi:hypothetical protein